MNSRKSTIINAILVAMSLTIFGLVGFACGDETPCEKARDIQKRICRESNSEKCYPCPCILRGQDYTFTTDEFGLPDLNRSECIKSEPCEGLSLSFAEACIEDERTCDPRVYFGIWLFDECEPEPAFPEICSGEW